MFLQILGFQPDIMGPMEFRAHGNGARTLTLVDGQLVGQRKQEASGLSCRALTPNGLYGFAAHPEMSRKGADFVMAEAEKNLKVLQGQRQGQSQGQSQGRNSKTASASSNKDLSFTVGSAQGLSAEMGRKSPWSDKTLIDHLRELDTCMLELGPELKSRRLMFREQSFNKEIWTGLGGHCSFSYTRCHLYYFLTMESEQGPVEVMAAIGGRGFAEDVLPSKEAFKESLETSFAHLKQKAKGVYPRAGQHTVILASKLAGILAHEAIGHTTEADLVRAGSVAADVLGEQVASPLVTLVDFAHSYQGELCPVPVFHDDECTQAQDTVIIQEGLLKGYMNSRETAAEFDQPATGHSRAWGFSDEPLIRMRNTAILPGASSLEEMIASVDDGYFLMDHSNGQADSTSEFMFGVTLGYEIKKGQLGRALLDTTISGVAFDMLKTVSMVSDEMTWVDSGTCGKKQPMYVGMGGPAIKCQLTVGGRS